MSKFLFYLAIVSPLSALTLISPLGEAKVSPKPEVMKAPKITKPLEALVVPKGSSVDLMVEFTGAPVPEVRWFRNGKEIIPTTDIVKKPGVTTLTLHSIDKKVTGKYEVRAVNLAGEARTSGSVGVAGLFIKTH